VNHVAVYAGLFLTALIAATMLPAQSEAVLSALLLAQSFPPALLVAVASAGNVLGSVLNWLAGRLLTRFRDARWFPASAAQMARAEGWYRRWGRWSLLASWLPFVGDPLTVAAGVMREPLWIFVLLVGIAKTVRYVVLALAVLHWA
jgi:membrane protein YqaA with SNARE-associated domain